MTNRHFSKALAVVLAIPLAMSSLTSTSFASSPPPVSQSLYIYAGENAMTAGENQSYGSGIVILHFGQLLDNVPGTGAYGTDLQGTTNYMSNAQIATWVQNFVNGWNLKHTQTLEVVVSGSNYNMGQSAVFKDATDVTGDGTAWADLVASINPGLNTLIEGGIDAEPAYGPGSYISDWVNAFDNETQKDGAYSLLINFGSDEPGFWTNGLIYAISWGDTNAEAIPQIYSDDDNDEPGYDGPTDTSMADEWQQLSLWAVNNNESAGAIQFYGVLDEYSTTPSIYPVSEAWTNFTNLLNSNSKTAQTNPILYLTNI